MRKGRYKKNLMLESECPVFAEKFAPEIHFLLSQFSKGQLRDCEFVAEYFLTGLRILKPTSWKGSRLRPGSPTNALETFETFSLRGIPLSAQRTLSAWNRGLYHLQLFFDVPSTEVVLSLQSQGIRCVTCLVSEESLRSYVMNERDPLSFTLHDLIHADHFLQDPHQRQVQMGFSRWMRELWGSPELQVLLHDPDFASLFEYACADMNSHGAHLVKYLKAIFCQGGNEQLLLQLSAKSNRSEKFQKALKDLNTSLETTEHLALLQQELFLNGAATSQNQENHSVSFREFATT